MQTHQKSITIFPPSNKCLYRNNTHSMKEGTTPFILTFILVEIWGGWVVNSSFPKVDSSLEF